MCSHEYFQNSFLVFLSTVEKQSSSLEAGTASETGASALRTIAFAIRLKKMLFCGFSAYSPQEILLRIAKPHGARNICKTQTPARLETSTDCDLAIDGIFFRAKHRAKRS